MLCAYNLTAAINRNSVSEPSLARSIPEPLVADLLFASALNRK